jgi:hypothetical protein
MSRVGVRAMPTSAAAAIVAIGKELRGEHRETGRRIEIRLATGGDRRVMGGHHRVGRLTGKPARFGAIEPIDTEGERAGHS